MLPATDVYPRITKLIFNQWQKIWNCCAGNKLHAIKPTVGGYKQKTFLSRRDSVLGLRIGHTRLTHSYFQVMTYLNVVLVSAQWECVDCNDIRNKHFVASSITDLFDNVETQNIIDFIKETRFYKQL